MQIGIETHKNRLASLRIPATQRTVDARRDDAYAASVRQKPLDFDDSGAVVRTFVPRFARLDVVERNNAVCGAGGEPCKLWGRKFDGLNAALIAIVFNRATAFIGIFVAIRLEQKSTLKHKREACKPLPIRLSRAHLRYSY